MCDPVSAISAGVGAVGAIAQGSSAAQTSSTNAAIHQYNAQVLRQNAEIKRQKAEFDVGTSDREFKRVQGKSEAAIGASGIDARSFFDVLADDAAEHALERKTIRLNAEIDAYNLETQAQGQEVQAEVERRAAASAKKSSFLNVASAIVGGFGRSQQIAGIRAKGDTLGGVSLASPF